jgi:hypothetical protein
MVLGLAFNIMYNVFMNFLNRHSRKLILLTYFLLPFSLARADGSTCAPGMICNPVPNITSIPGLIQTILTGVLQIGIPIVALAIIYCGFLFVKARGNPSELTKAKDALLYTVIGAAILLASWSIAQMISSTVLAL